MTRCVLRIGFSVIALVAPPPLTAQTSSDLLEMGRRAFQNIDYDAAATVLRRGLVRTTGDTLSEPDRVQALMYLGATELFRGRRDSALAVFRRLLVLDPRHRPNELVFPPQVTDLFRAARQATKVVAVEVPPLTELRVRSEQFTARLQASSPHDVTVAITGNDGTIVRLIYTGPISDSLAVGGDGLTEESGLPADGAYQLRVTSGGPAGRIHGVVHVPLEISRVRGETHQPSEMAPRAVRGPPVRLLAGGGLATAAAIVLPTIVARDAHASGARFAVASAIGVSTLVGFVTRWRNRPIDRSARTNQSRRDDRRSVATASPARLMIRAGRPAVLDWDGESP